MRYIYWVIAALGLLLQVWTCVVNPEGVRSAPEADVKVRVTGGPYKFLNHPLYVGQWMLIAGLAGVAAGFWNFLAAGLLAELVLVDWVLRERRK